jgi:uncharacterized protein YqhQ
MTEKIGGQAVIEGVMMKSKDRYCVAIRKKDGKIKTKTEQFKSITEKSRILKLPFVRGIFILIETLVLGIKTLSWSANQLAEEEGEEISALSLALTIIFSIILGIALFVGLPLLITKIVSRAEGVMFNVIDGVFRLVIFIVYVLIISLMKDVRRIFQYHGAEHKVVNCLDHGKDINLGNVQAYSTLHPRCGTAFIMIVLIISIVVFSFIVTPSLWIKFISRIVLIPAIAGFSYELLKLSDRYKKSRLVWILSLPGLGVQKITTREPDQGQIEVAIEAMNGVLR